MRRFVALDTERLPFEYDAEGMGAQPLVEVKETKGRIELSYRFPGFFRNDEEQDVGGKALRFESLDIAGVGAVMESGRPQLPSFGRYVQIPPGFGFSVRVATPGEPVRFEGIVVAPAQAKLTDGIGPRTFEYDEAFYASEEPYPKGLVTVTGPLELDGYRALLVRVTPMQYQPARKLLVAHPRVEVTIELAPVEAKEAPPADAADSREAFGNLFLNPRRGADPVPREPLRPILVGPELLVVHAPAFVAPAARLAAWKRRRGMLVETLAFEGALGTFAALKAELRRRRGLLGSRLRYVLLVGDVDDIPCERSALGNDTDYYLSTRQDPSAATPMPLPWLALGRIPVRSAAEADAVVAQIVAYERTPPVDPAYYRRFVCAAHFETALASNPTRAVDQRDYVFTMETIRAFLTAQGYDAERVYTCDRAVNPPPLFYRNGTAVPADVVAAITTPANATQRLVEATTEGHLIIAHRDHGTQDGWHMPPFGLAALDRVTGDVPSMFYSVNCLTGAFDQGTTTECFAEKVLRLPGTAPTLLASTEPSNTFLNNALMLGMFDAMYGGLLPTFPGSTVSYPIRFNRFGDILNYARSYVALTSTSTAGVLGHHEMYHVVGDPSLEVWSSEPRPLRIAARRIASGLQVELSAIGPGAAVTVWYGERLLKRLSPVSQRFTIPLGTVELPEPEPAPLPLRRILTICAWVPGCRFAEQRIPLLAPRPEPIA